GTFLRASGANTWAASALQASDIPSLTGTYVDLTSAQTIPGAKTFAPTTNTAGAIVRQTSASGPTADVFDVTNSAGTTTYFGVNSVGNATFSGSLAAASFSGSGASLANLNASNLSSGTVPAAVLSGLYAINISGSAATATNATNAVNF